MKIFDKEGNIVNLTKMKNLQRICLLGNLDLFVGQGLAPAVNI